MNEVEQNAAKTETTKWQTNKRCTHNWKTKMKFEAEIEMDKHWYGKRQKESEKNKIKTKAMKMFDLISS